MAQQTREGKPARPKDEPDSTSGDDEVAEGDTVELDRFDGKPYTVEDAGDGRFRLWPVTIDASPSPLYVGKRALRATIRREKARVVETPSTAESLAGGNVGRNWSREYEIDVQGGA